MAQSSTYLYVLNWPTQAQRLMKAIYIARLSLQVTFYHEIKGSGILFFQNGLLLHGNMEYSDGFQCSGKNILSVLEQQDLYPLQLVCQGDDISSILNEPVPEWSDQPSPKQEDFIHALDDLLTTYLGPVANMIRHQAQIDAKLPDHGPQNARQAQKLILTITHYLAVNDAYLFEKEARELLYLFGSNTDHDIAS